MREDEGDDLRLGPGAAWATAVTLFADQHLHSDQLSCSGGTLTFVHGDFNRVDLRQRPVVVTSWNGSGVDSDDDQCALLDRVARDQLQPDGWLIMDVFNPVVWARWAGDRTHRDADPAGCPTTSTSAWTTTLSRHDSPTAGPTTAARRSARTGAAAPRPTKCSWSSRPTSRSTASSSTANRWDSTGRQAALILPSMPTSTRSPFAAEHRSRPGTRATAELPRRLSRSPDAAREDGRADPISPRALPSPFPQRHERTRR